MAIRNRRLMRECQKLQVDFNRDIRLVGDGKLKRQNLCVKWNNILSNSTGDSLKRQLKSFCSKKIGI